MTFLTDPTNYPYETGNVFLGISEAGEVGVMLDRHAITVAGSRSGKGAGLIIPNLLRWPDNVLVIDPKGENAEKTWEAREAMGSKVYVLDPFETANVPARLRASFNPLEGIDPESLTGSADLEVIADGLVKRSDPKHAQWDDGAVTLLAGVMAFVIAEAPDEHRTLKAVRDILLQDRDELYADGQRMKSCEAFDGIAQDAGSIIMGAFDNEKGMEADFLSAARRHIKWINIRAMRNVLEESSFSLSELKNGKASVYVVLPPEYLKTHSAFMRLFTLLAINTMAKGGSGRGEKCLFILDEFFALGKMDEVSKSCGLMPSYGVHLWPFLQDLAQLTTLYQGELWQTFFSNSDASLFFGTSDLQTSEYVSKRIGNISPQELNIEPPSPPVLRPLREEQRLERENQAALQADYSEAMNEYNKRTKEIGTPRLPPDKVASIIGRKRDAVVASSMLAFAKGGDILHLKLAPYFQSNKYEAVPKISQDQPPLKIRVHTEALEHERKVFQEKSDERLRLNKRNDLRWGAGLVGLAVLLFLYFLA